MNIETHYICWDYILEQVEDSTYTTKNIHSLPPNDERTMSER